MTEPPLSYIENVIISNLKGRKQVSLFYEALKCHDKESATDRLEAWQSDIQENILNSEWEAACIKAQKQTINTRIKLLQHKSILIDIGLLQAGRTISLSWKKMDIPPISV